MSAEVQGRCPACGWTGLFLGSGGYVTCSQYDCPDPSAAADLLAKGKSDSPARERLTQWATDTYKADSGRFPFGVYANPPALKADLLALLGVPVCEVLGDRPAKDSGGSQSEPCAGDS